MTRLAASSQPLRLTASGLRTHARALHRPRVLVMNVGWMCVGAGLALSLLGVMAIGTNPPDVGGPDFAMRQIVFLLLGVLAALVAAMPHYQWLGRLSYPLLAIVLGLLIFVLIPVVPEAIVRPRNGARRWINLVVTDFQPSELAKIAYVLALANYLRYRSSYRTVIGLLLPLALTFVPMGLVLIEPDLGTSLLFLPTLFAMLIAAGARLKHIIIIVVLGLSLAPAMYPLLKPYQQARIKAMLAQFRGDDRHDNDIGYQSARAMTLAAAGGWTGVGKEHAQALVQHNHLPEEHNDMIFAVVCCRWGLLGAATVWGAFAALAVGGVLIAAGCRDPFGRLVAVGLVTLLFAQMTINTGMVIGLLPITGITLPFISYGGSSLIAAWIMIGLLLNIAMRRNRYLARHSFEYDPPEPQLEPYELAPRSSAARNGSRGASGR